MKPLTLEAYKLLYFLTGSKKFSYYTASAIIASLNVIVLMGFCILLNGMIPTKKLVRIFEFPINIGLGIILFFVNLRVVPMSFMETTNHVQVRYVKLFLYGAVAAAIVAYKILLFRPV